MSTPPRFDHASARDAVVLLAGLAGAGLLALGRMLGRVRE